MYYLYYGTDSLKARSAAQKQAALCAEGETYESITEESITESLLQDLAGASSMFREREVYILDTFSRNEAAFEILKGMLPDLKESPNVFVLVEEKLGIKDEKVFKEYAEKAEQFTVTAQREFNIFSLTDALSNRDKKSLWILLAEAFREGKTAEEIIGTLMWQLKAIRLAICTPNAEEAGLKPFVFDKAKRALRKYTPEEIGKITHALVMLYHEGHGGKRNIDHALEAWVLRL